MDPSCVPSRYMTAESFGYVEETHSAKGSHICGRNLSTFQRSEARMIAP